MPGQFFTMEGMRQMGKVLDGSIVPTIHLLQGGIPNTITLKFSDLTEADYDGYAPQAVAGAPIVNTPPPRQFAVWQWERQAYLPTDYTVQNSITGHVATYTPSGSSTPVPLWVESYSAPVGLLQDGDELTLNPVVSLPFNATAGVASPGVP